MPHAPPRACSTPGCPAYAVHGAKCADHRAAARAVLDVRRGSASSRGYGTRWREIRRAFLARHPLCVDCLAGGRNVAATDVDHVVARARGGTDKPSNLQALCHAHHSAKTAREDGAFGRARTVR